MLYFLWSTVKRTLRRYPITVITKLWFQTTLHETYLFIVPRPYLIPLSSSVLSLFTTILSSRASYLLRQKQCFISAILNPSDRHHKSLASPFNLTSIQSFHQVFYFVWILRLAQSCCDRLQCRSFEEMAGK